MHVKLIPIIYTIIFLLYCILFSGEWSQDFAGSAQNWVTAKKTKFEPGRVTAQRVILLL